MARKDPLAYFPNFLFKTWRTLGLPDPTPLQYDFAHYMHDGDAWAQIQEEASKEALKGSTVLTGNSGARKILMAFRGAAKTYVATTDSVFVLRRNPLEEVLVVSATDRHASNIATMAFNMVTQFDWLAPDMAPSNHQRQSALAFDVRGARQASKDESFAAAGIFGQITGRRATYILGDDLEVPNTSETETKRSNLRTRVGELGGAIIKPGGTILFLGTAQHEQTIYKEYADEKGYELRIYPVKYPQPQEMAKYGTRLAPLIANALKDNPQLAGTSTEPTRFDEKDIRGRQTEWGRTEFERQFLMWMDAGAGRLYPLKLRDLSVLDITPPSPTSSEKKPLLPSVLAWNNIYANRTRELHVDSLTGDGHLYNPMGVDVWLPAEEVICAVDPSGEGEDETSWAILAGLGGRVFLLKQGASTDGHTDDTLQRIAKDCAEWGVGLVKVESNFGGGMFSSLLRPHLDKAGCVADVEDQKAGNRQNKERRVVETLEPLFTSHRLVVNSLVFREDFPVDYGHVEESKRRFYRLTYQLTRMTKLRGAVRHDDRADALASGAAHFAERLQQALDKEHGLSKDKALALEAEKIIENRLSLGLPVKGWLPDANGPDGFGRHRGGRDGAPRKGE